MDYFGKRQDSMKIRLMRFNEGIRSVDAKTKYVQQHQKALLENYDR